MRKLFALAATLAVLVVVAPAQASIGVNVSPGWTDTSTGRNPAAMRSALTYLRPDFVRMPWVNNHAELDAIRWCNAAGIGVDVIVGGDPDVEVPQIVASGVMIAAVEGLNEPDIVGAYTNTPQPLTAGNLARITDHQTRLYHDVGGRWPVLSPSAAYKVNWDAIYSLPSDITNAHLYPSDLYGLPPQPSGAILPSYGKPVWVTETGQFTYRKRGSRFIYKHWHVTRFIYWWQVTQKMQRDYLMSQVGYLTANGAQHVFVYTLMDNNSSFSGSFDPSQGWGLFTDAGYPKLAATALAG
jgi:hypothetical protein